MGLVFRFSPILAGKLGARPAGFEPATGGLEVLGAKLCPVLPCMSRQWGLTQRQLGELAGVAHTTVQQLESLRRGAYPQTLRKLATALSVEPKDLL